MKIFKRKKKHKSAVGNFADVKTRIREFVLDTKVPNGHDMADALGCVPISDEIAEKEEQESDKRVESIDYLVPLIYGYASLFASVIIDFSELDEGDIPAPMAKIMDQLESATKEMLENNLAHFTLGAVSQMVDLKLLTVPKKYK
jgi:hypothetical protein